MRKINLIFFAFVLLFLTLGFASATFNVNNYEIQKKYSPGESLSGWLNISFTNEPVNSNFTLNSGSSTTLLEILELNEFQYDYTCNPLNCNTAYTAANPSVNKNFNLNAGSSALYGLKLIGDISQIDSIDLTISSDATESCANQLRTDFLDDGSDEIKNTEVANVLCSATKLKGCYDNSNKEFVLDTAHYCQKIALPEAPGFKVGAWVREQTPGTAKLYMELFDEQGRSLNNANCELPSVAASGGEISCDIDYFIENSNDYYVCVYADSGTGSYRVQGHDFPATACGFHGTPFSQPDEVASYNIFAQPKRFAVFGTKNISTLLPDGKSLAVEISGYIDEKYNGNCEAPEGCVIPIKFWSGKSQGISISNLNALIRTNVGTVTENEIYGLTDSVAIVSSNYGKLKLDNSNLTVQITLGNYTAILQLNNNQIFSEEFLISQVAGINGLKPLSTAAGNPTEFTVFVSNQTNVLNYKWEFGNGYKQQTLTNKIGYSYNATGNYELKVTLTGKDNSQNSKTFDIFVGSPKEAANATINEKLQNLVELKSDINDYDEFVKSQLEGVIDVQETEETIKRLQRNFLNAVNDDDYIKIMTEIANVDSVKSIQKTQSTQFLTYFPDENLIELRVMEDIEGDKYDSSKESKYINSLLGWNAENLDVKIKQQELSAEFNSGTKPVLNVFDLQVNQKKNLNYEVYTIFIEMENLKFKEDYSVNTKSGYSYIRLRESQNVFTFSTTGNVDFYSLPVFITPSLKKLIAESPAGIESPKFPWTLTFLALGLLIILAIIAYFAMQVWYKTKYEKHLFKNKKDVYNILAYIHNTKNKGLKTEDIKSRLKNAGWTNEQITYAFKKYSGKLTGLPGIKAVLGNKNQNKSPKPTSSDLPKTRFPK